ncbi:TPA: hypothetical protein U9I89_003601 [Acinetobacter baumannii]|nr:hypothetical protein [Acinetobacter baumannii]
MPSALNLIPITSKAANILLAVSLLILAFPNSNSGGVLKSMLTLNEAIIDVKEG